jgi:hypothetical protein
MTYPHLLEIDNIGRYKFVSEDIHIYPFGIRDVNGTENINGGGFLAPRV